MTQSIHVDCAVVGGGAIGLAIARQLALSGKETILLEHGDRIGSGISSRNSEVIHAGIYYKPGSLKGRLCVRGKALMYEYLNSRNVGHRRLGKIIVAVSADEISILQGYVEQAARNGVDDLRFLARSEMRSLEPAVWCAGAVFSPSSGIVDSHELMYSLLGDFERAGGLLALRTSVASGAVSGSGITLYPESSLQPPIIATTVVNSAGLGAQALAKAIRGVRADTVPPLFYAAGHYFSLSGTSPFRHLVYPIASKGGLGVHVTLDLSGRARFGPDVSWRKTDNYEFDEERVTHFCAAIKRYFPALKEDSLRPAYIGIRPKLCGPNEPEQDFMIQDAAEHGVPGLINLFGIESPGLTASLAIAEHVAGMADA